MGGLPLCPLSVTEVVSQFASAGAMAGTSCPNADSPVLESPVDVRGSHVDHTWITLVLDRKIWRVKTSKDLDCIYCNTVC